MGIICAVFLGGCGFHNTGSAALTGALGLAIYGKFKKWQEEIDARRANADPIEED